MLLFKAGDAPAFKKLFQFFIKCQTKGLYDIIMSRRNKRNIWNFSESNATRFHNHIVNHWLNGWGSFYELGSCGFESRCYHQIMRYGDQVNLLNTPSRQKDIFKMS